MEKKSVTFIIFGITGDLARQKIIPAFFELHAKKLFPCKWEVIGFLRKNWKRSDFDKFITETIDAFAKTESKKTTQEFLQHFDFFVGDINDTASHEGLSRLLQKRDSESGSKARKMFFLSVPPSFYKTTIAYIRDCHFMSGEDRILIEKPFGRSLKEAQELNVLLSGFVTENQVLRIDHYTAKDAMQNIASAVLPQNKKLLGIDARIIESQTVGKRGAFYDSLGAFLDVGQNHTLQMLATVMGKITGETKLQIFRKLYSAKEVVIAQYDSYLKEAGVNPQSQTETYFKARFVSKGKTFANVPLFLEAGKGFRKSDAEVVINYQNLPPIRFDFNQRKEGSLTSHAKLLLSAVSGDSSLFVSYEEAREEWRIAEEVIQTLRRAPLKLYAKGKQSHKYL
ncbi:MAG TPA: hypothetical protein VJH63_02505 [Candidatus Paceibacterota bacterium]